MARIILEIPDEVLQVLARAAEKQRFSDTQAFLRHEIYWLALTQLSPPTRQGDLGIHAILRELFPGNFRS